MKSSRLPLILFPVLLIVVLLGRGLRDSYSVSDAPEIGGEKENAFIIARTDIIGQLQRPGVFFHHGLHTKALKADGCSACHKRNEAGDLTFRRYLAHGQQGKEAVRDSFHDQCIGCHRDRLKGNQKSGPITCGNCHRKESTNIQTEYARSVFDFYHHEKHNRTLKNDCSLCHHIYDPDEEYESLRLVYEEGAEESCYYCHDLTVKRGPGLDRIVQVSKEKGFSMRNVAHQQCVNCHLGYAGKGEKAGPVECVKCHTGQYRTVADLRAIPRPDRDQPQRKVLLSEKARMKGVFFDHAFHERNSSSCRVCHHATLGACVQCHRLTSSFGKKPTHQINVYHDYASDSGCLGCHRNKKSDGTCDGCHYHLIDIDIPANGPKKEMCTVCHSGQKRYNADRRPFSLSELGRGNIPEKVTISILEEQYEPSTFPHLKIIKKLLEISNKSKMATAFHRSIETVCSGCHHQSNPEAAVKRAEPPFCRDCHPLRFDQQNSNKPRLLAVYHRQCMGCHERMGIRETGCTDCHKEKTGVSGEVLRHTLLL